MCTHNAMRVYVCVREGEKEREREREREKQTLVPNSRCVFKRSVTFLCLENGFSIVLMVYVLDGRIRRLCPHEHNFHFYMEIHR